MVWVRRVLAVVVGLVVAVALVFAIELISNGLYGPAEGVDLKDPQQLEKHVEKLPLPAFLIVLAAYFVGTFAGGWLSAFIAGERPSLFAGIIAGLMLAATAFDLYPRYETLSALGHAWFVYTALLGIPLMGIIAGNLAPKRRAAAAKDDKPAKGE